MGVSFNVVNRHEILCPICEGKGKGKEVTLPLQVHGTALGFKCTCGFYYGLGNYVNKELAEQRLKFESEATV